LLCRRESGTHIAPVGTAFAVDSFTKTILLTAGHCVVDYQSNTVAGELFITTGMSRMSDGRMEYENPLIPIDILECGHEKIDIAVLKRKDNVPFEKTIPACPIEQIPTTRNEEKVKMYHYPIRPFMEGEFSICDISVTNYNKLFGKSGHHMYLEEGPLEGSSGAAVVDRFGRYVGLIQSGYRVGPNPIQQPLAPGPIFLNVLWDTVTYLSNSYACYTRAIITSAVPNLQEIINNN
jgi:hypothetical protein